MRVKERKSMTTKRSIALCIILSIVTCGIYGIYWFICVTNDTNVVSGHASDGTSGGVGLFCLLSPAISMAFTGLTSRARSWMKLRLHPESLPATVESCI